MLHSKETAYQDWLLDNTHIELVGGAWSEAVSWIAEVLTLGLYDGVGFLGFR